MLTISLEILIILGLILVNGLLAMSEIGVVTSRKTRLQKRAQRGDKRAQSALDLANKPARFLSTVQVGITLVGILAGAFGGATIAQSLDEFISRFPLLAPYSSVLSIAIVVLAITYVTLVIGELVPKQIALSDPERVSSSLAPFLHALSRLTSPAISLLSFSSNLVMRVLRVHPAGEQVVSEDEIKIMIGHGARMGVFEPIEKELVDQVFRLGDLTVGALMTPRLDIIWFDIKDASADIRAKLSQTAHTYYPVVRGSLDEVIGIVGAKDLIVQLLEKQEIDMQSALHSPLFVPESLPVYTMLERFKETHSHVALAIDEFGSIQGIISLSDILEALVGEFPAKGTLGDAGFIPKGGGAWVINGKVSIERIKDVFKIDQLPGETNNRYQTLGGFVMDYLQKIPNEGDQFTWGGMHFEVTAMHGHRVDKVLLLQKKESIPQNESLDG
jgi:putative hemolysin